MDDWSFNRKDVNYGMKLKWIFLKRCAELFSIQWTTRITEMGITNLTRITNKMATSSDYLMKYFNGILAVLLE